MVVSPPSPPTLKAGYPDFQQGRVSGDPLSREHDARRAADADTDARRCQAPVAGDAIADDRAAVLVGDIEEALRGIEGEETRRAAMGRHPLARRQRAFCRIDGEHADAVVAAV